MAIEVGDSQIVPAVSHQLFSGPQKVNLIKTAKTVRFVALKPSVKLNIFEAIVKSGGAVHIP